MNSFKIAALVTSLWTASTALAQLPGQPASPRGATNAAAQAMPGGPMGTTPAARIASSGGVSPHETTSQTFDGANNNRVTLTFGRPYSKDPQSGASRKIWGALVPWGQPWRMGSDEATTLTCEQPLIFGATTIPAGAYVLYMIPSENGNSSLVFSSHLGKWGIPVDTTKDVAKVDYKKSNLPFPTDQLTLSLDRNPAGGGFITLKWEATQYQAAFTIKK